MDFEIFQSTTEREPRAGQPRVPAYVTYVEVTAGRRHIGVDSIVDTIGGETVILE